MNRYFCRMVITKVVDVTLDAYDEDYLDDEVADAAAKVIGDTNFDVEYVINDWHELEVDYH